MFLVVWGHVLQFATTGIDFFANPVFKVIYSFHMPVFMTISGYLFFSGTDKRTLGEIARNKTKQILVPVLVWAIPYWFIGFYWQIFHQHTPVGTVLTAENLAGTVTSGLWFFWSLYLCSLLVAVVNKLLRDSPFAYAVLLLVVLVLPNGHNFYFTKFMLPYFLAGYHYYKYAARLQAIKQWALYAALVAYPILLWNWRTEDYIYVSGPQFSLFSSTTALSIILKRYAIGFAGTLLFISLVRKLLGLSGLANSLGKVLEWVGKYSLGIYLVGGLMTTLFVTRLHLPHYNTLLYSLVVTPLVAVAVTGCCGIITWLIGKWPFANQLLLGGR